MSNVSRQPRQPVAPKAPEAEAPKDEVETLTAPAGFEIEETEAPNDTRERAAADNPFSKLVSGWAAKGPENWLKLTIPADQKAEKVVSQIRKAGNDISKSVKVRCYDVENNKLDMRNEFAKVNWPKVSYIKIAFAEQIFRARD